MNTLSNNTLYPNLQLVTLAGFSAGAQLLNRYAWASNVGSVAKSHSKASPLHPFLLSSKSAKVAQFPSKLSKSATAASPAVRFIISDASSYLYFNPSRPDESCRPLTSDLTSATRNCSGFHPLSSAEEVACETFDDWKYGLAVLPTSGYAYLQKYLQNSKVTLCKMCIITMRVYV